MTQASPDRVYFSMNSQVGRMERRLLDSHDRRFGPWGSTETLIISRLAVDISSYGFIAAAALAFPARSSTEP